MNGGLQVLSTSNLLHEVGGVTHNHITSPSFHLIWCGDVYFSFHSSTSAAKQIPSSLDVLRCSVAVHMYSHAAVLWQHRAESVC